MLVENIYEKKDVKLKAVSPIHIGNEQGKISKFEFIINGNFVYPISEERLANFLLEKILIDDYISEIETQGRNFNLLSFLSRKKVSLSDNEYAYLSNNRKIRSQQNLSSMVEFHPLIRDGFALPYIPGTSIKGAIRTAVLYCYMKRLKSENPSKFTNYIGKIESFISKGKNKKEFDEFIIEDVFQNFNILGKNKSPNTDWLRMLHISDAYPLNVDETILIQANILKKENNNFQLKKEANNQPTAIWVECFPVETVFIFEMVWDKKLLEEFGNIHTALPKCLDDLLVCLEEWSNDIVNFERDFFTSHQLANWYKDKDLNFRLGFGSGMISTSLALLFEEDLRKKIRNYAGLNRGTAIAPKSRRIFEINNISTPFGWAKIEFIDVNEKELIFPQKITITNNVKKEESVIKEEQQPTEKNVVELKEETINVMANISYFPNKGEIIAEWEGMRSSPKKLTDKSFIPQEYHKELFDKKEKVKAKVTVKKTGNLMEIVKVEKSIS